MFDLNVLAFQPDLMRVSSFLMGREKDGWTYAEIGVPTRIIRYHISRTDRRCSKS
jgi:hypothetical protein